MAPDPLWYILFSVLKIKYYDYVGTVDKRRINSLLGEAQTDVSTHNNFDIVTESQLRYVNTSPRSGSTELMASLKKDEVVWVQWESTLTALVCFYEAYDSVGMNFGTYFKNEGIVAGVIRNVSTSRIA